MLGKLALGETPEAEIADDVEKSYDQIYAKLESKGLVAWPSAGAVPDKYAKDVAALVAFEHAEGIPTERYAKIEARAAVAELSISASMSGKYTNPRDVEDF